MRCRSRRRTRGTQNRAGISSNRGHERPKMQYGLWTGMSAPASDRGSTCGAAASCWCCAASAAGAAPPAGAPSAAGPQPWAASSVLAPAQAAPVAALEESAPSPPQSASPCPRPAKIQKYKKNAHTKVSNTKGYSSTYLAIGFANVRAGTQKRRAEKEKKRRENAHKKVRAWGGPFPPAVCPQAALNSS